MVTRSCLAPRPRHAEASPFAAALGLLSHSLMMRASSTPEQQHLGGDCSGLRVKCLTNCSTNLVPLSSSGALQHKVLAPDQLAARTKKSGTQASAVGRAKAMNLRVHLLGGDDFLTFHHPLDGQPAGPRRPAAFSKVQVFGGLEHLARQADQRRARYGRAGTAEVVDHGAVTRLWCWRQYMVHAQLNIVKEARAAGLAVMSGRR